MENEHIIECDWMREDREQFEKESWARLHALRDAVDQAIAKSRSSEPSGTE